MTDLEIGRIRKEYEAELESFVRRSIPAEYESMLPQLTYHMGWDGEGAGPETQGKRVRPMIVLLASISDRSDWHQAIPAAHAVELLHNFSLSHDDVQDNSPIRHGRPTLWKKWGIAQAINAGDQLFNLAFSALNTLGDYYHPSIVVTAHQILNDTCTRLTGGQHLDISFETRSDLTLGSYISMITGKTAALLGASAELGALCAQVSLEDRCKYRLFGQKLGLAFQVWDDWLGIWGAESVTGKSNSSDLVSGKKSLPVIFGLANRESFTKKWKPGSISIEEASFLAELLIQEGAQAFTENMAQKFTEEAVSALETISCQGNACLYLKEFAGSLLRRSN